VPRRRIFATLVHSSVDSRYAPDAINPRGFPEDDMKKNESSAPAQDASATLSSPRRRTLLASSAAALLGSGVLPEAVDAKAAVPAATHRPKTAPDALPAGYNILFILVDQEHFFPHWPMPVPAREWFKANGITFLNHQGASCVCSPARSTVYTGQHIQHTGIFDNANEVFQNPLSTQIKTIGHRMSELGYHSTYQGKWHLSANLKQSNYAIDAPFADYRKIIESYGFDDFFGVGDICDGTMGGYQYDETCTAFSVRWLRTKGVELHKAGKPWYLAVNFVNPHDVMYFNSDLPGETVQGKDTVMPINRAPEDALYQAKWDVPLPASRKQPFDAPGRPKGQQTYQESMDVLVGKWPDEDRRWKALRDYYYNCIRDCDRQVMAMLDALKASGMADKTIIVFTADHGELSGNHQMRGKGTCTYWQQNHLPLMIVHPDYPGGMECKAVTSQIDLTPTLLALTGAAPAAVAKAADGLKGRDFSGLLKHPKDAKVDALRPAALFNYNMLTFQDAKWAAGMEKLLDSSTVSTADKIKKLESTPFDFNLRGAIRSIFDGRYRFSRYFAPGHFNTPTTFEDLVSHNDLEVYDLKQDPEEMHNLALDAQAHRDLIMSLNAKLNERLAEEVGVDDGSFLPIRDGKWYLPDQT
jgi:arylsulfatase A-like enzyme